MQFFSSASVEHLQSVVGGPNLNNQGIFLFEDQLVDFDLDVVEGLFLIGHEVDEDFEEARIVLFSEGVDFEVLFEDENDLVSGHFGEDEWFREGIDEEVFGIGI